MSRFDWPLWLKLLLLGVFVAVLGITPNPPGYGLALRQARRALEGGNKRIAAGWLAEAADWLPWRRCALLEQAGHLAMESSQTAEAILYWEKDACRTKLSEEASQELAGAYYKMGRYRQAILTWQTLTGEVKEPGPILASIYETALEIGDVQTGLQTLQEWNRLAPQDAEAQYRLSLLLAAIQPEEALDSLMQVSHSNPQKSDDLQRLRLVILKAQEVGDRAYELVSSGRELASLGEWRLAQIAFGEAVRLRPDYAEAWAFQGEALQHSQQTDQEPEGTGPAIQPPIQDSDHEIERWNQVVQDSPALAALTQALRLDPQSQSGLVFTSYYWLRRGEYLLALSPVKKAIQFYPDQPQIWLQLGQVRAAKGDFSQASQDFQKAMELAPHDLQVLAARVEFSLQYNYRVEELALPLSRRLYYQNPASPLCLDLLAQVLYHQGFYERAEFYLERALAIDSDYAPAHLHLGMVGMKLGETKQALQELRRAYKLAPQSEVGVMAKRLLANYFP